MIANVPSALSSVEESSRSVGWQGLAGRVLGSMSVAREFVAQLRAFAPVFSRGVWVLMLLTHAMPLYKVWKAFISSGFSPSHLGGCVALSIAMLFFVLKLKGVPCLRFRSGWQSWVAICLVIGIIHVDCIRAENSGTFAEECTVILATATLVSVLTKLPRACGAALGRHARTVNRRSSQSRSAETVWLDVDRPRCWVLSERLFLLRAPPCC